MEKQNKIAVLRKEIRLNPYFFIKKILNYRDISNIHAELITFTVKSNKEILILIPRGHFKTSVITIGLAIWFMIHNRNIRININNKILSNAKKFLGEIKEHLCNNKHLIELYGNLKGEIWQTDQIRIAGRTKILKEPTIQIGALGHEVTSAHFDLIINDDLVGLKDMVSEAERITTLNFYRTLEYLKDNMTGTKIINIGTRWHLDDLYSYILNKLSVECVMIRQAIINNKSLFPELYSIAELSKMKDEDLIMFSAQMMNQPIPTETQLFKYEELKWFDINMFNPSQYNFVNYTDFAMSKSSQTDFTANITLAYNKDSIFVVDCYIERYTPDINKQKIKAILDKYDIDDVGAEANAFQELYVDELQNYTGKMIRKIKHMKDKILRVNGIHSIVIREVYFRQDWESAYPRLIEQLIRFPEAKHDDGADALEGAISMIRKNNKLQYDDREYEPDVNDMSAGKAYLYKKNLARQKKE